MLIPRCASSQARPLKSGLRLTLSILQFVYGIIATHLVQSTSAALRPSRRNPSLINERLITTYVHTHIWRAIDVQDVAGAVIPLSDSNRIWNTYTFREHTSQIKGNAYTLSTPYHTKVAVPPLPKHSPYACRHEALARKLWPFIFYSRYPDFQKILSVASRYFYSDPDSGF